MWMMPLHLHGYQKSDYDDMTNGIPSKGFPFSLQRKQKNLSHKEYATKHAKR